MSRNKPESQTSARPEFHFALSSYQINALTGLIYIKGIFHLFLFKNSVASPELDPVWSHFQSKDLLEWTVYADIPPDSKKGRLHSGFVLFDHKNTSGFGANNKAPMIAFCNHESSENYFFLHYSKDHGQTWEAYGKGPVVDIKKPMSRDPFIFWHGATDKWIMLVTIPNEYKVLIYSSKNLTKWEMISDFGGHPSFNKKWSHASLTSCRNQQNKEITKWILTISLSEGDTSNRYFVGEFDGRSFKCDHALDALLKIDHGKDFYAPTVCILPRDQGTVLIGQMSHTSYEDYLPTHGWKGMLTLPREIHVSKEADGSYRLVQSLYSSWTTVRSSAYEFLKSSMTNEVEWDIPLTDAMEFDLRMDSHKGCTVEFDFGSKTKLLINWDVPHHQLSLDRTSKNLGFHPAYNSLEQVQVTPSHILALHIILDKYSIELFADGGRVSLTSLFFSPHALQRFRITGKQFAAAGMVWNLKGVYSS